MFFMKDYQNAILGLTKTFWIVYFVVSGAILVISITLLIIACVSLNNLDIPTAIRIIQGFFTFAAVMILIFGVAGAITMIMFAIRLRQSTSNQFSLKLVSSS